MKIVNLEKNFFKIFLFIFFLLDPIIHYKQESQLMNGKNKETGNIMLLYLSILYQEKI